jgi:hypothetical protein
MSREKSYLEKPQRKFEKVNKPIGEGASDSRMAKITFKNYLRQIEEDLLDEEGDMFEDELKLPSNAEEVEELYDAFISENEDLISAAREKDNAEDGAEFFMDELKVYLERKGFTSAAIDDWFESESGNDIYEMFWNGLT